MNTETTKIDGVVLYTDGSFRRQLAGWGVHGYTYTNVPLKQGIGVKQLPTAKGYLEVVLTETVTPVEYIDAFGSVADDQTNNRAELLAAIRAFEIAEKLGTDNLVLLLDSEYVRLGLTKQVTTWIKNHWCKADGEPVKNQDYWEQLVTVHEAWTKAGKHVELRWIKGHSGNLGNDTADCNSRLGSAVRHKEDFLAKTAAAGYFKPQVDCSPLMLRKRAVFSFGDGAPEPDNYYYMYNLGRSHGYGHKQGDTFKDRVDKTDLIYGRRIPDATFCVFKAEKPDEYIEALKRHHAAVNKRDVVDLGIILLDNALRPGIYQRVQQLGEKALVPFTESLALVTENDDLISKTLDPARLAYEAVSTFNCMRMLLDEFLAGKLGAHVTSLDVTDAFYGEETAGKKTKTKLHKTITNNTPTVEFDIEINGKKVRLKPVLGIDIPNRNQLAKIAELEPKVTLLVSMVGPAAYSFSTVYTTIDGSALYQSPYMQFVLPR